MTRGNPSFVEEEEKETRGENDPLHFFFPDVIRERKAKFCSTATTSSGTNGMLFLLGTLGGHQLQYHCRSTVGGRGNYLPNCQFEASFLLVQWICAQSKLSSIMMSLSRATSGRLLGVFT